MRVFALGLGDSVDKTLVTGMASAGNGTQEFVKVGQRLQGAVIKQLNRCCKRAITQLSMDCGGDFIRSPFSLPAVYSGESFSVYFLLREVSQVTRVPYPSGHSAKAMQTGWDVRGEGACLERRCSSCLDERDLHPRSKENNSVRQSPL